MKTKPIPILLLCALNAGAQVVAASNYFVSDPRFSSERGITINSNQFRPYQLVIRLDCATNWTGIKNGMNELGYVVTNHIAVVFYQGATNEFQLKSVPTDKAVWREHEKWTIVTNRFNPEVADGVTNYWR